MRAERAEQRGAAARANAPIEEAHQPIDEEEELRIEMMDVDDDEEEQKVDEDDDEERNVDDEEEQRLEDVLGSVVLSRKSKLALKDTDLCTYFCKQLEMMSCPNRSCGCLEIVRNLNA